MLTYSEAIVIGGSAGSIPVLNSIISALPKSLPVPVIVCVHRMKNVAEGIREVFQINSNCAVTEPDDKAPILPGSIYIAPSNYHLLVAPDRTFSLSTDRLVNYSRPAIDLTFQTASQVYKSRLTGILLTGANKDGALGMHAVKAAGGTTIVQDPEECSAPYMPASAIALKCVDHIFTEQKIIDFLLSVSGYSNGQRNNLT